MKRPSQRPGKPSIQGCGLHTVLPGAPGSGEVPSGFLGEETGEGSTNSLKEPPLF